MKKLLPILLVIIAACSNNDQEKTFQSDLKGLQEYFHIPGLAVIVTQGDKTLYEDYLGFADLENRVPMDSTVTIPMASLTKMFSGMLLKELPVMDRSINEYGPDDVGDSVKVKHVLSHTSQGEVGKHFYYSYRYGWLTSVIEEETGKSFEQAIGELTANMGNTYLLIDSAHLRDVAKPYVYDGEVKPGFIDYGYSSASGIVSTVRDIAKFSKKIDPNFKPAGLYSHGLFSQDIEGNRVLWAYGQYDCYSSLFIKVPEKNLTLVIAANNNLMSDPPRMIYGDVRSSLFALSFFKNFLNIELPREQLRAKALAESFLNNIDGSKVLLRQLFREYPNYKSYGDLALLHNLIQVASDEFAQQTKDIGAELLKADRNNPYANIYMAEFYLNTPDSARSYFRRIAEAKNFSRFWYTNIAEGWLKEHP